MKVTVIAANTINFTKPTKSSKSAKRKDLKTDKGQSFFIQTVGSVLIYDFGAGDAMFNNMQTLGLSPEDADMGCLSCGNSLHSGGLESFASINMHAEIYARSNAFLPHYQKGMLGKKDISLDSRLAAWSRMVHCKKYTIDGSERFVTFSLTDHSEKKASVAAVNEKYFVKDIDSGNFFPDDFTHEMYLLVKEGECWTLFCGDAHAGIVNIVNRAEYLVSNHLGGKLTAVIGAWSLTIGGKPVSDRLIDEVAKGLKDKNMIFYTGHTTGQYAFDRMKSEMGEKLRPYSVGTEIVL